MEKSHSAFTLIELLTALSIAAVLAALSLTGVATMIDRSKSTECLSNMRQLGLAAFAFAQDNNMTLPVTVHERRVGGVSWTISLQEYAGGTIVFRCPRDENRTRAYTYVINDFLTPSPAGAPDLNFSRLSRLTTPSQTFLFAEAAKSYTDAEHFHFAYYRGQSIPPSVFSAQVAAERHTKRANYVFADGHAECLSFARVKELLAQPDCPFVDPTVGL